MDALRTPVNQGTDDVMTRWQRLSTNSKRAQVDKSHELTYALSQDLMTRLRAAASNTPIPPPSASRIAMHHQFHKLNGDIMDLQERINVLQRDIAAYEARLEEKAQANTVLTSEVTHLNTENDKLVDMLEAMDSEKEALENEMLALREEQACVGSHVRAEMIDSVVEQLHEALEFDAALLSTDRSNFMHVLQQWCLRLKTEIARAEVSVMKCEDDVTEAVLNGLVD